MRITENGYGLEAMTAKGGRGLEGLWTQGLHQDAESQGNVGGLGEGLRLA